MWSAHCALCCRLTPPPAPGGRVRDAIHALVRKIPRQLQDGRFAIPMRTPPQWSSSSSPSVSLRSCVSNPSVKPAVDRREQVVSLGQSALVAPEAGEGEAGRSAQLQGLRLLTPAVSIACWSHDAASAGSPVWARTAPLNPRPIPQRLRQPQPFGCRASRIVSTRFDARAGQWQDVRNDQPSCSARSVIDFEWPLSSCAASGVPF